MLRHMRYSLDLFSFSDPEFFSSEIKIVIEKGFDF